MRLSFILGKNSLDSAGRPGGLLEKGSIAPESTGNFSSILKKRLSVRSSSAQTAITPAKSFVLGLGGLFSVRRLRQQQQQQQMPDNGKKKEKHNKE